MATIDSLSVRVTGDSDSFERSINSAERSLAGFIPDVLQASGALQILQGRADEAGDEVGEIAPRAVIASAGLDGLSLSAAGSSTAFAGLSVATVATLIPALVALSTVLFPLVGALGGFVAIAGGIVGVGAAGAIAAIAVNTERLKEQVLEVGAILQEEFGYAIEQATIILEMLLETFVDIIPELVPTKDVVNELAVLFFELGEAVIELLPMFVDLATTLAAEFLPGFTRFVDNVGPQLPGIINGMVDAFVDLLPTLRGLGRWLMRNSGELTDFGFLVLDIVVPAISTFGDVVVDAATFINDLDAGLADLTTKAILIAPLFAGIATLLGGPVALAIAGLVGGVIALNQAWENNFAGIRDDAARFGEMIQSVMPAARDAFEAFIEGVNLPALTDDVSELTGAIDEQLTGAMKALQPVFNDVKTLFEENEEEFRIIGGAVGFIARSLIDMATVLVRLLGPAFETFIIPVIRGFIDLLDFAITKIAQFIELAGAVRSGDIGNVTDRANELLGTPDQLDVGQAIQTNQEEQQRLEIVLQEETDVIDSRVERGAENVIVRRERRSDRLRNRGTGI